MALWISILGHCVGYQLPRSGMPSSCKLPTLASTPKNGRVGQASPRLEIRTRFTGVSNGGGRLIHNLFIEEPATSTIGMFGVDRKITDVL